MVLTFNLILRESGFNPRNVRLLRHQTIADDGRTPYTLWRNQTTEFEIYQSAQLTNRRQHFSSRYWASFVVPPDGTTLFAGLYEIFGSSAAPTDWVSPLSRMTPGQMGQELLLYNFKRVPNLDHLIGLLTVEWGPGTRAWAQRADSNTGNKTIIELKQRFQEPNFPGFNHFISKVSELPKVPVTWVAVLSGSKGIYLLTCPQTREQYVGAAYGGDGFWGRWQSYIATGHGGNVGLKSRNASDYQVSILEVAGSAVTTDEIIAMEQLWKRKLQSREMGLNEN